MSFSLIFKHLIFIFTVTIAPIIPNIIIINPNFRFDLKLLIKVRPFRLNPSVNLAVFFSPGRRITLTHRPSVVGQLWRFGARFLLDDHRVMERWALYPGRLRVSLPGQLVRSAVGDGSVHREGDGGVEPPENQSIRGNLGTAVHLNLAMLVVLQNTDALERRGPWSSKIIHEKFQVKFSWICGSKPHAAREISLYPSTQRYHPHFFHIDRAGELHEVQVEFTVTTVST